MPENIFNLYTIDSLEDIFNEEGRNNYQALDIIRDKRGGYIFQNKTSHEILYIGQAFTQDLKTRITQNFTEGNTGGCFKDNFLEENQNDFNGFKTLIRESRINCITIGTDQKTLLTAIESILIAMLKPKYNK